MGLDLGPFEAQRLTGGVSSDIWLIRGEGAEVVLKRPLERLRVAADWHVSTERGDSEAAWLAFAGQALPGSCPQVLGFDAQEHAIALEYLAPGEYSNWKADLLAGHVDQSVARDVGRSLGRIHAVSARTPGLAEQFDRYQLFESLRVEPYLRRTAQRLAQVSDELLALAEDLRAHRSVLVHGDVSPKNILCGSAPVFLDAECATWADPAFDLAFCTTHLLLKQVHLPEHAADLRRASLGLASAYLAQVDWEDSEDLRRRAARLTPALMLARVVGASPVEYLTPRQAEYVVQVATSAIRQGSAVEDVLAGSGR